MRLEGRVAVVTGASSDIGRGIVSRLASEGARVVMVARDLGGLEEARQASGSPDSAVSIACDLTDESQAESAVVQVMDEYGRVDILVNSAGRINDPVHFHEMDPQAMREIVDANLMGTFHMTRAVLARMSGSGGGSIVNIGSTSGERAVPRVHLAVYSATKAAIAMFTKSIAVEYARRNIRCNCVSPGIINSGMIKPYLDDPQARRVLEDRLPIARIGEPADVAAAVLYLASDDSSWVTGAVLNVDGGKAASEG